MAKFPVKFTNPLSQFEDVINLIADADVRFDVPDGQSPETAEENLVVHLSTGVEIPASTLKDLFSSGVTFTSLYAMTGGLDSLLENVRNNVDAMIIAFVSDIDVDNLSAALKSIDKDPEVYFLSATGHLKWKGSKPYL